MKKTTYKSLLTALAALMLTACAQDELMQDNTPDTDTCGSLHVTEVTLPEGGMQSRLALENGSTGVDMFNIPFNVAATGYDIDEEFVYLDYSFGGAEHIGYLKYNGSKWEFSPGFTQSGGKYPTRPNQDAANGESWAEFSMQASSMFNTEFSEYGSYTGAIGYTHDFSKNNGALRAYFTTPADWTYDAGRYWVNDTRFDVRMYIDKLVASTEDGGITADTDLNSPTLGSFRVALKHAHAMLRLPKSSITTEAIIVDELEVTPTFRTLWAVLSYGESDNMYIPLTEVGDNYQAFVPVKEADAAVTLTGFQVVYSYMDASNNEVIEDFTTTLSSPVALQANTRYPLTLALGPLKTRAAFSAPGKPGWEEVTEVGIAATE